MCIVWAFSYIKDPLTVAYFTPQSLGNVEFWQVSNLLVDLIMLLHVFFCFFAGYYNAQTKTVELRLKKIVVRYLFTYFFFDLIGAIPFNIIYAMMATSVTRSNILTLYTLSMCRIARLARYISFLRYSQRWISWMTISDVKYIYICFIITAIILIHWGTCTLITLPALYKIFYGENTFDSWLINVPNIEENTEYMYLYAMYIFTHHFYLCAPYVFTITNMSERFVLTAAILAGYFYITIVMINMFVRNKGIDVAENRYEEFMQQIKEYTKSKKINPTLSARLKMYVENRFQSKYFDEAKILDTLSLHLRYEVVLHSCHYLFRSVKLFHGLPKAILGYLVATLTSHIYLGNDVILKIDDELTEKMFFIAYGTVAVYTSTGTEICHLEDGDFFGETRLLYPEMQLSYQFVAAYTSEIFVLNKKVFRVPRED